MRSVAIPVSTLIVTLLLCACVPLISDDGSADTTYVTSDKISICGYAKYDTNTDVAPQIFVFVGYEDPVDEDVKYIDAKGNGTMMKAVISGVVSTTDESLNYYFEVTNVPLIDKTTSAHYYVCVFYNFRICTVSSMIDPDSETEIVPDDTWETTAKNWEAWQVEDSVWNTAAANDEVFITGKYDEVNKQMSGDLISLERATGTVTGHVNGSIAGKIDGLDGVLVQFSRSGTVVTETRTDDNGNYTATYVPTGDYTVTFSRGNYTCDPVTVTVNEGTNTVETATMTLKINTDFFGYDLAHFLAILGGAACVIIIVISIVYQWRRIKRKKSGKEWILDDMEEIDEDEEK